MNAADFNFPPDDDRALLEAYARNGSERAFAELVRRHVAHVHAAALRRVNGDRALAADVTQTVFADLARRGAGLLNLTAPGGWLHRHTGFVAGKCVARERRRRSLEQEAVMTYSLDEPSAPPDSVWAAAAPLLDSAMDALPEKDRDALVLRFFERRDFRAVGAALGVSDDTAQKRVSRALEKLRAILTKRGAAPAAGAALPALLLAFAAPPAPAALAAALPGKALALAAARPAGWLAFWQSVPAWQRPVAALAAAAVAVSVPVLARQQRRLTELESERVRLFQRIETAENAAASTPSGGNPVPAAPEESVESLVAKAAEALRGGAQNVSATAAALGFLTRLSPERLPEALELAATVPDAPARALLYKHLLSQWAENDAVAALDFGKTRVPEEHRAMVCEGVLSAWAARNPESLLGWNQKTTASAPPPVQDSLNAVLFKTLASRDPAAALRWTGRLEGTNARAQALRGILETVQTEESRERLMAVIEDCQDEGVRAQARRAMVEHWAQRDPAAAAAWVDAARPAWERTRLMDSLGFTWMQSDPEAAARWWLERAPGPDTLVKIVNVWAQEDPNAAGTWLSAQPPGPQSDTARMTFARQVADLDPDSALHWAETVTDDALRESTIDHVWRAWHGRDPEAARAFLQAAAWPAERATRLTGAPR